MKPVNHPISNALEVARYFLSLADMEAEATYLTPLSLQKLLYYGQGWALEEWGTPLFGEPVEAWVNGPAVKAVWDVYQGRRPILDEMTAPTTLDSDTQELLQSVWSRYKRFSPIALSEMTHAEDPWLNAREGLDEHERSGREITQQSIAEWFRKSFQQTQDDLESDLATLTTMAKR